LAVVLSRRSSARRDLGDCRLGWLGLTNGVTEETQRHRQTVAVMGDRLASAR